MRMKRLLAVAALTVATLTGCASGADDSDTEASSTATSGSAPGYAEGKALLAEHDLDGMDAVEVVDHLDQLGADDRPTDLMASVRPTEVVVASGEKQATLPIPEGKFYLSVAPYVNQTHKCFYHSLTTCQGELSGEDVAVEIVDAEGKVLIDERRTTYENGFLGFWLPRDTAGTLRITHDEKVGEVDFATDSEAPTCVTTLQLA